ncbi:hypothetical protein wHmb_07070 [Wolbachia pipientis]|nr:hypothetical protein wHmb_07070 [Wolbachia pipientis]
MFMAKRQPSSRYVLAAKRYRGGMTVCGGMTSSFSYVLADEIPRRYDGSWRYDGSQWHDDKLVIPLLVSG